jgi:hypothetical protein
MIIEDYIPTLEEIRSVRNRALTDSDFVVLMHTEKSVDVPQEWIDYRQALRDLPAQEGFPDNISWPTKPS